MIGVPPICGASYLRLPILTTRRRVAYLRWYGVTVFSQIHVQVSEYQSWHIEYRRNPIAGAASFAATGGCIGILSFAERRIVCPIGIDKSSSVFIFWSKML